MTRKTTRQNGPQTRSAPKVDVVPIDFSPHDALPEVSKNSDAASDTTAEVPYPTIPPTLTDIEPDYRARPLIFLATLAVLYTLFLARAVFLPIAMSLVLSLLLRPIVRWLGKHRVPETVSAALCVGMLMLVAGVSIATLVGPAQAWMVRLPSVAQVAAKKLKSVQSPLLQLKRVREQLELLSGEEKAAGEVKAPAPVSPANKPITVEVMEKNSLEESLGMLSTTAEVGGSIILVMILTFFILTSGDQLINNILTTMPTIREKRQFVELIQNVQKGVSSYLFTVTLINIGLGLFITLVAWLYGLPNPFLWGILTTVLNYIPFLGQLVCGMLIGLAAVLTFDSLGYALLAPLGFYAIAMVEGNIITPIMIGHRMSLNPIMVFVFLTFWGWMWGIGGALLAVPILAIVKITFDQFERTKPLGTMLG